MPPGTATHNCVHVRWPPPHVCEPQGAPFFPTKRGACIWRAARFLLLFKVDKINYNDGYATNGEDGARISDAERAEVEAVLRLFEPRVVVWAEDVDIKNQFNPNCSIYNENGEGKTPLWRFISQWHGLRQALNLVLDYERSKGARFDWAMKLRPDLLWYHGLKPYCGYSRAVAYNPSVFGSTPVPYYDWFQLVRGDLAAQIFDTLGNYRACVGESFGMWTQGDAVLTTLKQQGLLAGINRELGQNFLPGYVIRKTQNEFCADLGDPRYFSNSECSSVLAL